MDKGKRLSAEERREQILEAALDEFARAGFNGARTREVARRAGISETLVFRHFGNKERLYQEALDHLYQAHPMHEDMREPMERGDDLALFTAMALHMMSHTRDDPRIIRLHLFQLLGEMPASDARNHVEDESTLMLAKYIQQRMDQGVFARGDALFHARLFHYTVFMALVDRQFGLLGQPLAMADQEMAEALGNHFLKALQP